MNINFEKNKIYTDFVNCFGNFVLTKGMDTPTNRGNSFSIYYAKVGCLLCIEDRFIVVVVPNDGQLIGNHERLSNLNWISFQTRIIDESPIPHLKAQELQNNNLSHTVSLNSRLNDRYVYDCDEFPLRIELLLDEDNANYSEKGTLKTCLDTYMCVVNMML